MRLWIVSEVFHPHQVGSAYVVTHLARGLAREMAVHVVTGPVLNAPTTGDDMAEELRHVQVTRCVSTTFSKDRLPLRVLNALTGTLSMSVYVLSAVRRGDVVIALTSPPLLPFFMLVVTALRRVPCVLLVHDVYPEVLTATNLASARSPLTRALSAATRLLYRRMHTLIVIGRDMRDLVLRKDPGLAGKTVIIPNWADTEFVRPAPRESNALLRELGMAEGFVVQYAGNMGRTHDVESIVDAAAALQTCLPELQVLFIGDGAKRRWVEHEAATRSLRNVTRVPTRPRSEQPVFLNACDVAILGFVPGMSGVSMPSRTYNIMAAGKPIIAIADETSELARLVREEGIGWVIPPGDRSTVAPRLCDVLLEAHRDRATLAQMGQRARAAAERSYSFAAIVEKYDELVRAVSATG